MKQKGANKSPRQEKARGTAAGSKEQKMKRRTDSEIGKHHKLEPLIVIVIEKNVKKNPKQIHTTGARTLKHKKSHKHGIQVFTTQKSRKKVE